MSAANANPANASPANASPADEAPARLRLDLGTRIESIDPNLAGQLGYTASDLIEAPFSRLLPRTAMASMGADLISMIEGDVNAFTGRHSLQRLDGSTVMATVSAATRTNDAGTLCGFDITVLADTVPVETVPVETVPVETVPVETDDDAFGARLSRRLLTANESLFRSLTESSPVGIARLALDHSIAYANPAFTRIAGADEAPAHLLDMVDPDDRERVARALQAGGGDTAAAALQCRVRGTDEPRWVTLRFARVLDDELGPIANTVTVELVTGLVDEAGHNSTADLAYLATHDSLTGLPNRSLLHDHIEMAQARSERDGGPIAVLFIDLDRFKDVNDTHGHDAGDELLREIATRVANVLRPSDTVARLGGDEFVVLCEDIDGEADATTIASRIRESILTDPPWVNNSPTDVSMSVGIAISDSSADTADDLLRQADAAMYRAKQAGGNRIELFDEVLRERNRRRQEMRDQLEEALDNNSLEVHYQPIVDLTTGRIRAVEALVRWMHPTRGPMRAGSFIDVATAAGLDSRLDRLVLARACSEAARWYDRLGHRSPTVHVNLAGRTLSSGVALAEIERSLAKTGLPATKLCIELAEGLLMDRSDVATERLARLHELGVGIAIDGVGSGSTSLRQLRRYHLDVLKVDASLTSELLADPVSRRLAGAAISLGRALDLTVGVEAIEDADAIPVLKALGAQLAQGRVFSPPVPAKRLFDLLDKRNTLI